MVQQKTVSRSPSNNGDEGVMDGVASLGNNIITLLELQAKLAVLEGQDLARKSRSGVITFVIAAILMIAAVPVALIGLGEYLHSELLWARGTAYLAVAGGALLLGLAGTWLASRLIGAMGMGFPRTRDEWVRNRDWVTTVLTYSGRPVSRSR